ncbi:WXG100 family type VII secretion target [Amycolatopsis lurida]|uniref:WXG100 family type VII secretion target n=1 Tax=Amycolatopsis sp. YIM 10 TaxID=2653857 RepID=UPI001290419C|nr:WXG100 family type VII secretion target [Amycolatopsis sp. YIM 10]QFU87693.1 WXG domain conatining protein [Amycolatopsis sp. YIM 10]
MADMVEVNFNALQFSSASLAEKAKQLTGQLETLQQNLQPIKATWYASGSSAGQAAEAAETRLRQATADIVAIIAQFGGKVGEAHDTQYALENRNTNYFAV